MSAESTLSDIGLYQEKILGVSDKLGFDGFLSTRQLTYGIRKIYYIF
jgi:hypothetical protein